MLALLTILPLFAQETVLLRPEVKVSASRAPEHVEDRGSNGVLDRAISEVSQPSLTVYLPPKEKATGTAVVICPGGGYQRLAIDKEGHDVARWLSSLGVAGLVLEYRLPGKDNMARATGDLKQAADAARVAIEDAEQAMRLVRANAARWSLRPDAIGMMGFSAGGHLAAMMGMTSPSKTRPDFLALIYPALPQGLELTAATPPTFLAHADDDKLSAGDNSVRFYLALKKAKVPAELHVYATGGHGFGIRKSDKTAAGWTGDFARWLARPTEPKLKVLVVTGGHGFQPQAFWKMFDDDAGITYTAAVQSKAAEVYDRADLLGYDVVVLYDSPSEITPAQQTRFRALFERGVGLVILHHALLSYQRWPEYERVAGGKYLLDDEKAGDQVITPESTYQPSVDIPVKIVARDHPITAGLSDFTLRDELYHRLRLQPDLTALLEAGGEPLLWTRTQGKSRVVATVLGHGRGSFEDPNFLKLLARSIRWAARRP
jgi:acetyl esterase/lipase/type 1 glutamine amidotransferase